MGLSGTSSDGAAGGSGFSGSRSGGGISLGGCSVSGAVGELDSWSGGGASGYSSGCVGVYSGGIGSLVLAVVALVSDSGQSVVTVVPSITVVIVVLLLELVAVVSVSGQYVVVTVVPSMMVVIVLVPTDEVVLRVGDKVSVPFGTVGAGPVSNSHDAAVMFEAVVSAMTEVPYVTSGRSNDSI